MSKIDKVRAEIERRLKYDGVQSYDACEAVALELQDILDFIDSLSEEPVSEDLEKEIQEEFPEEWMKLDDKVKTFIIRKIFNWGVERQKTKDNAL